MTHAVTRCVYTVAVRESDLIAAIVAGNVALPGHVRVPPGDDMAMLSIGGAEILIAVDQVIAGVHYDPARTPIEKVGRKAVCRNLSDVAAMAAKPSGMVCCLALPRGMAEGEAKRLIASVQAAGERYGCPLVGGDTGLHDGPLTLSVTVLAEPAGIDPVTRAGAKLGDLLFVTGTLGGTQIEHQGHTQHLDFEPRLDFARRLAASIDTEPCAMIDLSDGLASDVRHIAPHARLLLEGLPLADSAHAAAERSGRSAIHHALGDGEDHELLFSVPADQRGHVTTLAEGALPVTCIGSVAESGGIVATLHGQPFDLTGLGWEHGDG